MSMIVSECCRHWPGTDFSILATDISTQVLQKAALGIYHHEEVKVLPFDLRKRYLMRSRNDSKNLVRVVPQLRGKIRFKELNLINSDFAVSETMDLIFFRNVMIYFDKKIQGEIILKLCDILAPGGHLFVGHSESLHWLDSSLEQVGPAIYRKTD